MPKIICFECEYFNGTIDHGRHIDCELEDLPITGAYRHEGCARFVPALRRMTSTRPEDPAQLRTQENSKFEPSRKDFSNE